MHTRFCHIAYAQKPPLNTRADVSGVAIGLKFGLSLQLHSYFVYVSRKGTAQSAVCPDWPEPSLLAYVISNEILCTGPYNKSFSITMSHSQLTMITGLLIFQSFHLTQNTCKLRYLGPYLNSFSNFLSKDML